MRHVYLIQIDLVTWRSKGPGLGLFVSRLIEFMLYLSDCWPSPTMLLFFLLGNLDSFPQNKILK
jgi:hypothetical protein